MAILLTVEYTNIGTIFETVGPLMDRNLVVRIRK